LTNFFKAGLQLSGTKGDESFFAAPEKRFNGVDRFVYRFTQMDQGRNGYRSLLDIHYFTLLCTILPLAP
jgi:hypothetical protein